MIYRYSDNIEVVELPNVRAGRIRRRSLASQPHLMTASTLIPNDSVLLPLTRGKLLVSPSLATFCRIGPEHEPAVQRVVELERTFETLPDQLVIDLRNHGFGGPPREAKPESPSVQIQLTNACNLTCSYCCTNSGEPRQREVDRQEIFDVIDDVRDGLGPGARMAMLGGEPLLIPWALEACERALDRDLSLTLFTNGTLLGEEAIAEGVSTLQRRGAEVRVSLAGATKAICDRQSGSPRFEKVIDGVHALARRGTRPIVDLMLLPDEADTVAENLHVLRRKLPADTKIALGVLYLSGRETGEHLFRTRTDLETALDSIAFGAGEVIAAPETSPVAQRREGCTCALGHHLHVRSDGSLFTCFKMEERVGHLSDRPFIDALTDRKHREHPTSALPMCLDCPLATLCGGGCRSENLQYTGGAETPVCGPWRVRVLSELLAEDRVTALEWPAPHLISEAKARGIDCPQSLVPSIESRHLIDT